ncbi:hypothetical protein K490DRAFT_48746 [Saccharata proteae CBS 121410]|uniref:PQ loop repeat protein n=1 Tax=Saccharata proteae CBS 121410 TaxID=1314787 RepID=A0A9P4LSJ8_9PEZI|nr:hypothetical protein K490DRAFT_48746 [Saccharata proteae CBS 121410]
MGFFSTAITNIAPIFYADQIYSIHRTRSSAGFSLDIPLIMLVASILKMFYWLGARFALSLLIQAAIMIVMQLILLHVALTNRPPPNNNTPFAAAPTPRPYNFWQWRSHRPYWQFLTYFTVGLIVMHILIAGTSLYPSYSSLLGMVGLAIEAILPLPQIFANQRARSTKGFRPSVLLNWLVGDVFKMCFFFLSGDGAVPLAFKVCGLFQASCDAYLGVQWYMFGNGSGPDGFEKNEIPL